MTKKRRSKSSKVAVMAKKSKKAKATSKEKTKEMVVLSIVHFRAPLDERTILLEGSDSNPRTLARADLQSTAFNHSATFQLYKRKRKSNL